MEQQLPGTEPGPAAASPPITAPPTFYNVAEAAELLRLDSSTLYRHLRGGRFPGVKIGGRYVVPRVVLEQVISDVLAFGRCLDVADWAAQWHPERGRATGGAA